MRHAFSFRLSRGTSGDENIARRSILSLILASALRTLVGVMATNEAKTHRLGFVELSASGLSASMILSRVETHDKAFDVSPALVVHILLWALRVRCHTGLIADFEGKSSRNCGRKQPRESGWREARQLLSATVTSLSGLESQPFARLQASWRE